MNTFTIENESNNIILHASAAEAETVPGAERFSSAEELAELAATWPTARLIDIWNGIPGVTAVTKFKDRKTAVNRIWNAIQTLGETHPLTDQASSPVAEAVKVEETEAPAATPATEPAQETPALEVEVQQEATEPASEDVQPEAPASHTEAHAGEQAPDVVPTKEPATQKATRKTKAPTGEKTVKAPRAESKTSRVIEMLKREGGVTLDEIMTTMSWQAHTTRALLSAGGALTKNHGLVVTSEVVGDKRIYSIKA